MGLSRSSRPRGPAALLIAALAPRGSGRLLDGRRPADGLAAGLPAPRLGQPAPLAGDPRRDAEGLAPEDLEDYMAETSLMAMSLAQDAVALSRQARGLQEALREARPAAPAADALWAAPPSAAAALPAEALEVRGWAETAEAQTAPAEAAQAQAARGWPEVEDAATPRPRPAVSLGLPPPPAGGARRREEEEPLLAALDASSAVAAAGRAWPWPVPPLDDAEAEAYALLMNATEVPKETSTEKPPWDRNPLSSGDKAAICGEDKRFECNRFTEIFTLGYRLSVFWSIVAWAVAGVVLCTCCCCCLSNCCRGRGR